MLEIEQIKEAVHQLSPGDLASFRAWFNEFDADSWDQQFELDVTEGRLDALAIEALRDADRGRCTDLRDSERRPVSGVTTVSCRSRSSD